MDSYVDTWVRATDEKVRAGSDLEHILTLIRNRGFVLPQGMTYVRVVHLLDAKRKELMIIYAEDVAGTALTAAELRPNGKRHDRWSAIEKKRLRELRRASESSNRGIELRIDISIVLNRSNPPPVWLMSPQADTVTHCQP